MWYNFTSLLSRSSELQKELRESVYPRSIMNPVGLPFETIGKKDGKEPAATLAEDLLTLHMLPDAGALADFALNSMLSLGNARRGSFFVWDEYKKVLVLKVAIGQRERVQGTTVKLREGIAGKVADKGQPVLVSDIRTDQRFSNFRGVQTYQTYSFMSLPLIVNNKLIGLINLTEKSNGGAFSELNFEQVQAFAKHVGVAYENLKSQNRLRNENEELGRSVTQLKETLSQSESLVSLGKLVSHLGHELANPLDAIRRFVGLALDQVNEDGVVREYLLKAKRGIRRSIQVIRGVRELAQTSGKNRKSRKAELNSILQETIKIVSQDHNFENVIFKKHFCTASLEVEDYGFQTVFRNLFQNAFHAMNGSGTIIISTELTNGHGKCAVVRVCDSGHGVPEGIKARIFEPFFTTKDNEQGTGVGLTICREIVQRSGGQILCESVEKKGTEFIITVPCKD